MKRMTYVLVLLAVSAAAGRAQTSTESLDRYARQVFFDNAISENSYFYSRGRQVAPSTVELVDGKVPITTSSYISAPNSLKLHWTSAVRGAWNVELRPANWPNRYIEFPGKNLSFWVYSEQGISGSDLPQVVLQDATNGFTGPLLLSSVLSSLPAGKWTRIQIPIARFESKSVHEFNQNRLNAIILAQRADDGVEHTMLIDDVRVEDPAPAAHKPASPTQLAAKGYERHVDLTWSAADDPLVTHTVIYRSDDGGTFKQVGVQRGGAHRFVDFLDRPNTEVQYRITQRTSNLTESAPSKVVSAKTHMMNDDELLDMVEESSFHYYWDGAEPNSGMSRESVPGGGDIIATGGSGFGIMSMVVAADRHFVPREEVVQRLLRITNYLEHADRFHGAWPHFLSGRTGHVLQVFGIYDNAADLVETSFLMQGLLAARGYFTADRPDEKRLRDDITKLWEGIDWQWFVATPKKDALYWHWSPEFGFEIANRLQGYNETMITYLLAIASPTHAAPASIFYSGWEAEGNPSHVFPRHAQYYGIDVQASYTDKTTGPLFFTHYNFFGLDPHFKDKNVDWFANSRAISQIQQKYAIENPNKFKGFGADAWGMSAVSGPRGYHEFSPGGFDDGTLAPTATFGAYAYTPEASMMALHHFYRDLGRYTFDIYGFRNAFNQQLDWYSPDELALNQAPQAIMIENGRTGLVWRAFMSNPEIIKAQRAIGMKPYSDK